MFETLYSTILAVLENLPYSDAVSAWNAYCDAMGYSDDLVFPMEELDDFLQGMTPWEITRAAFYGDFCPAHDYFWFNGYGNLVSGDGPYIADWTAVAKEAAERIMDDGDDDFSAENVDFDTIYDVFSR